MSGQVGKVSVGTRIAQGLSALMLFVPFLLMIGGAVLCVVGFPHIMLIFFGAMIFAVGVYVRPRRPKVEGRYFTRDDLPKLFALTDQVAERLGGQPITKVQLGGDFNAHSIECEGDRVLGIGFALWQILTPDERIAIIAHEISHQVNGDQARTGVLHMGLHSVECWHSLFSSSQAVDDDLYYMREPEAEDIFGRGVMWVFATMFEQFWVLLTRLSFLDSQRAEYFADAIATRASGRDAMARALLKTGYMPLLRKGFLEMAPSMVSNGTAYFEQLCRHAISVAPKVREEMAAKISAEEHCVDSSHPPTFERIQFLGALDEADVVPIEYSSEIDDELAPFIEAEGRRMLQRLEIQ